MQKSEITLNNLQKQLSERERDLRIEFASLTKKEKDILMKTVKLQEEVGELANDILSVLSLQRKSKLEHFKKKNLYQEFADVTLSIIALANALGVDLDRAIKDKLKIILQEYSKDK
ncbi:hypothetical protein A3E10_00240 [Candidatus Roizmanbacteria bacterium RIFCSPHIGHO2_12_FULL_37_23]|nr:MAG: hypothetical protein A3E10_00240 [Candidatus Roizmanbacteria bacterium RIFCSPHIGHO2_12_FULL_37_23]